MSSLVSGAASGAAKGAAAGSILGPLGSVAGAVIGLGSAVYGGIKSSQQANKARQLIQKQRDDNRKWYESRASQDYTMRSDAQAALSKQREFLNEQYRNARNTNIVAGGSEESLVAQKKAANQALAQTTADISADAARYKDAIDNQYIASDNALNQQQAADYMQQSGNTAQAASQAVGASLDFIGDNIKLGAMKDIYSKQA